MKKLLFIILLSVTLMGCAKGREEKGADYAAGDRVTIETLKAGTKAAAIPKEEIKTEDVIEATETDLEADVKAVTEEAVVQEKEVTENPKPAESSIQTETGKKPTAQAETETAPSYVQEEEAQPAEEQQPQPEEEPQPEPEQQPQAVWYSPDNVVSLAISKCKAGGMVTTEQHLKDNLDAGKITQEEYNAYYPLDGLEDSYYSVFVNIDLNKAATTSGRLLGSEEGIAQYIADMLLLESNLVFNIRYAGIYKTSEEEFYEFRCHR